jgi:AcrR family transcriptional regulator
MEMKERIQQKAEQLFRAYGIRSVTMDEIASQLGISKKTIYQSFSDKEEVVAAVFHGIIDHNKSCCLKDRTRAENPVHEIFLAYDMAMEMFRDMNPAILFDLMKYHPEVHQRFQEYKHGFLYEMISANLKKGIEQELYRNEIDIDILTRYRIESAMMPFNSMVFPDNKNNLLKIEAALFDHFLHGIATPKGIKLIEKYKKQRQPK